MIAAVFGTSATRVRSINFHLGYELLPSWWVKIPPFTWTSSSTYQNLHHQKLKGNSTAERSNSSEYSTFWRCAARLRHGLRRSQRAAWREGTVMKALMVALAIMAAPPEWRRQAEDDD